MTVRHTTNNGVFLNWSWFLNIIIKIQDQFSFFSLIYKAFFILDFLGLKMKLFKFVHKKI